MTSNASPKKTKKREYESDEEQRGSSPKKNRRDQSLLMDSEDEHDLNELEDINNGVVLPALKMIAVCEQFREYLTTHKKIHLSAKNLKTQALEFVRTQEIEDATNVASSLPHYLRLSLKLSSISLDTALRAMTDFLGRGETVLSFPDFPEKSPSVLNHYAKKNNLSLRFGNLKAVSSEMNADVKGKAKCEEEVLELTKTYLSELRAFETRHLEGGSLTPEQTKFLRNMIMRVQKKVERSPGEPRTPSAKKATKSIKVTEKKTPFELFVLANKDKYVEYDEEKRIRKLQKKFDKLDEDTRNMFLTMSLNI